MKVVPIIAVSTVMIAALEAANERRLKKGRSRKGSLVRASRKKNPASSSGGGDEQQDDTRRRPAPGVPLDEREGEAEEAGGGQGGAGQVETRRRRLPPPPRDERQRQGDAEEPDRKVEPEHGRPSPAVDEDAAEGRPEGGGGRADGAEQAGGEAAPRRRVGGEDDRQGGRDHGRRADRLHGAPGDQRLDRLRRGRTPARRP